jgi:modulator of FtsH protease HflC
MTRARRRTILLLALPLLVAALLAACLFTVDVTQYGVVMRFGQIVRTVAEPGLHLKLPFEQVLALDRRWVYSRPEPGEYLTVDKRNVVVESVAIWRVADAQRYLASLTSRADADIRLADALMGEVGAVIGTEPVAALIAPDGRPERFEALAARVRERVAGYAGEALGVEVAAVQLLHVTLPEQNRVPVFERMKAERGRIAKQYRSAGELLARKIVAQADREKLHIEAEAYAKAQRLRAEADAEAGRIYARAYGRDPGLYKFQRSLKAYEKFLDEQTTLFLPANAEVLRVLRTQRVSGASGPAAGTVAATGKRAPEARAEPHKHGESLTAAGEPSSSAERQPR